MRGRPGYSRQLQLSKLRIAWPINLQPSMLCSNIEPASIKVIDRYPDPLLVRLQANTQANLPIDAVVSGLSDSGPSLSTKTLLGSASWLSTWSDVLSVSSSARAVQQAAPQSF